MDLEEPRHGADRAARGVTLDLPIQADDEQLCE